MDTKNEMTRRKFMGLAGGAIGMATLASMGIAGWAANQANIDPKNLEYIEQDTDVLVVGGGMAGLFATVKAHDAGARAIMVSKGRLGSSGQTPFAKGIFAYDPNTAKVSIDEFAETVSRSALGSNNSVYTKQMAKHSLARVNELKEWGFFDSALYNKAFSKPINERNISLLERIVITNLIKEKGKIVGAAGFCLDEEKVYIFNAKSVILCTGAGGFKPNGFPICDLTHDGTIMAYNIGAKVTGKEWNDGHPGQATNAADCFTGWHGMFERKPSVNGIEVHHDLGVDINYMAYSSGNPVQMGPPGAGGKSKVSGGPFTPTEFSRGGQGNRKDAPKDGPKDGKRPPRGEKPGGVGKPGEGGGPPGMGGTSVGGSSAGMAIHKSEGLVPINDKCESNIPGLYAAGDALGSYMSGGIYTQIGSSLAGSAVQGAIAGEAAAEYSANTTVPAISKSLIQKIKEEMLAPLHREAGYSPAWVTQTLQGIMIPNFVLYVKKENMLKAALAYVEELRNHHVPMLRAADMHELRLAHETVNMIATAEMKLKASLMRKESRCSHYRMDYPDMDNENWQAWINIFKGNDGSMQFEKQAFGTWPNNNFLSTDS
ncbi:FAD-binding protein [Labilibaculum sp. DW002]|uniref:FAD-binding protein n=1 Tax=Paralabilibaculum antarcticum TaxID=2912572 RepID=A0ABT5VXT3_9BACT|nr:FAD-binding protein [Labilibaculum sp. DW002]MDE5420221.1 FAD-binding protein [Labilibaculum sp. DW002]